MNKTKSVMQDTCTKCKYVITNLKTWLCDECGTSCPPNEYERASVDDLVSEFSKYGDVTTSQLKDKAIIFYIKSNEGYYASFFCPIDKHGLGAFTDEIPYFGELCKAYLQIRKMRYNHPNRSHKYAGFFNGFDRLEV